MNKQQLANKIWESANRMRSKIEANEYKDYILGFIFYKYLSDREIKFLYENDFTEADIKELTEEDSDAVDWLRKNIGYFIAYENLFSTWLSMGKDFDVSNVTDALSAFSRLISPTHKKVFENIFRTLETGLSKLGDTSGARTKAISGLLQLIKDIPMDGRQDYDVLGFIYEYLIEKFAANAGKKAGEFYTPHEVSVLMSDIVAHHLRNKKKIEIYDPTSGSGSLLINIGKSVSRFMDDDNNIKYYAQELKENTYNLTRMNLIMRGIKPDNISARNGDTLEEDWPYFDEEDPVNTYDPLYVSAVVSNPPYSQAWDPTDKEGDPRYARFGLAPRGKADYAFLLHDLYHLKPDGIMTIVLPHGVLFRGGEEGTIRKNLIEFNHIDTIIGLPANIFFGTGIPTIIMVLKQKKDDTDILIVDASKGFVKDGKNNRLRASDIKRIVDAVISRSSIDKFSRLVSREEIRQNEYNLNIPRYVDSSEEGEGWDIYASMFGGIPAAEIERLNKYWEAFPTLRHDIFTQNGTPYATIDTESIEEAVRLHPDVVRFRESYNEAFSSLRGYLSQELFENMQSLAVAKEEQIISGSIFERLRDIKLVDKYEAYQILHDEWTVIAADLEMIQTEGFNAVKAVEPNLVIKKKAGKDEEVQDGWKGHILPFELVQEMLLSDETAALKAKENRLSEIPSELEAIADELTEDEKQNAVFSEDANAFVSKEISKKRRELKNDLSPESVAFDDKLERAEKLFNEEKKLKSEIRTMSAKLHTKTKDVIEGLSDEDAYALLERKWIDPVIVNLQRLPDIAADELIKKLKALREKYAETYFDIEKEIRKTETELAAMIDDLCGNEFDMKGLSEFRSLLLGE